MVFIINGGLKIKGCKIEGLLYILLQLHKLDVLICQSFIAECKSISVNGINYGYTARLF